MDVAARGRTADYVQLGARSLKRRGFQSATAWLIGLIAGANGAVVVWLWLHGGGISAIHDAGTAFTSLGRITGLLGAYLLLWQVLLLARIPWLERVTGFDSLTVWHRINGKACLYLVLAHVVFITIGYAMMDRLSLSAEATALLTSYPGMVEATIGTGLLVLVVVSSLVIVRRRLRYEAWYAVHLLAYAGIILGWFHQIPTGNEFAINATAAGYWTLLYVVTLIPLILFRFFQPALRTMVHNLHVANVVVEGPNVVSVHVTGRWLDQLGASPGQFFLWRFLTRNRWWESHPFSLSAAPDGRSLRLTAKDLGDFTRHMGALRPGTPVVVEGPFGAFTEDVARTGRAVLIAGGIGITPIRALAERMSGDAVIIYRAMREEDVIFREELARLEREGHARVCYVVGDHRDPGGERLLAPDHLQQLVPDIVDRDVYICGPPAMANAIEANVRHTGVAHSQIHTERFALAT